jgi:hypothetical protein
MNGLLVILKKFFIPFVKILKSGNGEDPLSFPEKNNIYDYKIPF